MIEFGGVDVVPPPPINLQLLNGVAEDIMLIWEAPPINDFDHYNVYESTDGGTTYTLIDATVGVQYFLTVPSNGLYMFYVTTVDHAGQESVPSNIVQAHVVIGIDEPSYCRRPFDDQDGTQSIQHPQLNIDVKAATATTLNIRVYDMTGAQVATVYNAAISEARITSPGTVKPLTTVKFRLGVYFVCSNHEWRG